MAKKKSGQTLSQADRETIFQSATRRFAVDYGEMFAAGMTDHQLRLGSKVPAP